MKKSNFSLILIAAALLISCNGKPKEEAKTPPPTTRDSLTQAINQRDEELNDMISTFNDIQEGLRQISEAQGRVTVEENVQEGKGQNKQAILDNIAFIQRTMQLNRDLVQQLRQQLRSSTGANSKLRSSMETAIRDLTTQLDEKDKQIAELKQELAQKDIHIAEQDQQISSLNDNITNLNTQNEEKSRTVAAQDKELNTAWYVFGTKSELKEQKIMQRGDVLRSNQFNRDYFTRMDIRVDKVIKLYSKSARLLTAHPSGSYTLEKDTQGQYTLRITNPQQFWSISRYLVILVK